MGDITWVSSPTRGYTITVTSFSHNSKYSNLCPSLEAVYPESLFLKFHQALALARCTAGEGYGCVVLLLLWLKMKRSHPSVLYYITGRNNSFKVVDLYSGRP